MPVKQTTLRLEKAVGEELQPFIMQPEPDLSGSFD
jgi:hypothetical protein